MFERFRRSSGDPVLRTLRALVPLINAREPEMQRCDDDALRARTGELRARLDGGEDLDDLMVEAFAVVREASRRVLGERHHDVQLLGGAAIHLGKVAEMKTGEGKTLASTLPVYLNALGDKGVHIVTANEYLAERDAEWMGRVHRWLGLDVGVLTLSLTDPGQRRERYAADVTYGTIDDFAVDYLRDHQVTAQSNQRQRGHHFALVDDADSLLVDRCLTFKGLNSSEHDGTQLYQRFASIARELEPVTDYEVDDERRTVVPTAGGIERVERSLGIENLYHSGTDNSLAHHLQLALQAKELCERDEDYVVADGEVRRVDEHTGRTTTIGWGGGLHQAVQAKEGVTVRRGGHLVAKVPFHSYFRMYDKLAAMTGTAAGDAATLRTVYGLEVVAIPTNVPVARTDGGDVLFRSEDEKLDAVATEVAKRRKSGQPVLVGATSVERAEELAERLERRSVPHHVVSAKRHEREAEVIAQAGRLGSVTVATNMAGRGVDIKLGGDPELLARQDLRARDLDPLDPANAEELEATQQRYVAETASERCQVIDLGGLCVLGTERHPESRRHDDQLRGRAGRQGEPGESRFYLSLDDELVRKCLAATATKFIDKALDSRGMDSPTVMRTFDRRQHSLALRNAAWLQQQVRYDEVEDEQREVIYTLRDDVLAGTDLRARIVEGYLPRTLDVMIETHCADDREDWDLEALSAGLHSTGLSNLGGSELGAAPGRKALHDLLVQDALARYERREEDLTPSTMRQAERIVLCRVIDRSWSTHLDELQTLRDGISWRALGRIDPLHAWRQDAYDMFEEMMRGIARDTVRYAMTAEVRNPAEEAEPTTPTAPTAPTAPSGRRAPEADGTGRGNARRQERPVAGPRHVRGDR